MPPKKRTIQPTKTCSDYPTWGLSANENWMRKSKKGNWRYVSDGAFQKAYGKKPGNKTFCKKEVQKKSPRQPQPAPRQPSTLEECLLKCREKYTTPEDVANAIGALAQHSPQKLRAAQQDNRQNLAMLEVAQELQQQRHAALREVAGIKSKHLVYSSDVRKKLRQKRRETMEHRRLIINKLRQRKRQMDSKMPRKDKQKMVKKLQTLDARLKKINETLERIAPAAQRGKLIKPDNLSDEEFRLLELAQEQAAVTYGRKNRRKPASPRKLGPWQRERLGKPLEKDKRKELMKRLPKTKTTRETLTPDEFKKKVDNIIKNLEQEGMTIPKMKEQLKRDREFILSNNPGSPKRFRALSLIDAAMEQLQTQAKTKTKTKTKTKKQKLDQSPKTKTKDVSQKETISNQIDTIYELHTQLFNDEDINETQLINDITQKVAQLLAQFDDYEHPRGELKQLMDDTMREHGYNDEEIEEQTKVLIDAIDQYKKLYKKFEREGTLRKKITTTASNMAKIKDIKNMTKEQRRSSIIGLMYKDFDFLRKTYPKYLNSLENTAILVDEYLNAYKPNILFTTNQRRSFIQGLYNEYLDYLKELNVLPDDDDDGEVDMEEEAAFIDDKEVEEKEEDYEAFHRNLLAKQGNLNREWITIWNELTDEQKQDPTILILLGKHLMCKHNVEIQHRFFARKIRDMAPLELENTIGELKFKELETKLEQLIKLVGETLTDFHRFMQTKEFNQEVCEKIRSDFESSLEDLG